MYELRVEDGTTLFEMVMSLSIFLRKNTLKYTDGGNTWAKEVISKLDPTVVNAMTEDRDIHCWERYATLLLMKCPYKKEPIKSLEWVSSLSSGDLFELLSPYTNGFDYKIGEENERYISYLSHWYTHYYSEKEEEVRSILKYEQEQVTQLANKLEPAYVVETVTNGFWIPHSSELNTIILIPSLQLNPLNVFHKYNDGLYVIYFGVEQKVDNKNVPQDTLRMIKAMGDENRLKMLKFLSKDPKTFSEVLRFTKLSKATVYQHLVLLRNSGLLRYHLLDDQFQLKENALSLLNQKLELWLNDKE